MRTVPLTFNITGWKNFSEKERYVKLAEFADNGAEHIVLGHDALKLMGGDYCAAAQIQAQLAAAGLDFLDAHAAFGEHGDLFAPDEREHRRTIAYHKLNLALVADFGVSTCTFHIGSRYRSGYTVDQHRDAALRSLDVLLPEAERLGITICLENLRGPLNTVDDLLFFMRKFDSGHLGLCLDVGHANLKENGMKHPDSSVRAPWAAAGLTPQWEENIAERMQPYIVNCHIHDNFGVEDNHFPPGNGTVNWRRIVPLLREAPRLTCIQSEVYTTHTSVRALIENIRALLNMEP